MVSALIIEPNSNLDYPYKLLGKTYNLKRCASVETGLLELAQSEPDIIFISASFAASKLVTILDAVKNKSKDRLIPVIFVIDLSNQINRIPGTTWGNKIGVLTSISTRDEYNSTLRRVLSS